MNILKRIAELEAKETLTQDEAKELIELKAKAEADKKASVTADAQVQDLVKGLGEKIVEAIALAKGDTVTPAQKAALANDPKVNPFASNKKDEIDYPADLSSLTKEETIITFFKALVNSAQGDVASNNVLKALVEGTDADGGYLVPEIFATEVWRVLPDITVMRRLARILPMTTDTLNLNTLTAIPEAYWTSEYASKATSSADFGRATLTPHKLVCLLPVSQELLADANIPLVEFITQLFAERIGAVEDKAYFTGSGTGQPRGISIETLTTVNAGNSVSFDDIIALIDSVPQKISQSAGAAFVGHRYAKRILRQLKDTTNSYIWRDGGAAPSSVGETKRLPDTLYGYPFNEQNDLAQTELYFGDWKYYIIGDRQTLTVMTTLEGGDAWRRDSMEIKAKIRVDGRVVLTSPFAKITNLK